MACPSQRRFTANQIELFLLGLVQVGGAFEVGAAILVEKGQEQVVAEVVVAFGNDECARFRLEIKKNAGQEQREVFHPPF